MLNEPWADLPFCDWVYFATPARASGSITAEFVLEARAIIRTVYNTKGIRIANVSRVRPGDRILLVYGGHGKAYRPVYCCTVESPSDAIEIPGNRYRVFKFIKGPLAERLREWDYEPDPVLSRFMGIAITDIQDVRQSRCTIAKPAGNGTLRHWKEVFLRDSMIMAGADPTRPRTGR
jgi:hypothetical protein